MSGLWVLKFDDRKILDLSSIDLNLPILEEEIDYIKIQIDLIINSENIYNMENHSIYHILWLFLAYMFELQKYYMLNEIWEEEYDAIDNSYNKISNLITSYREFVSDTKKVIFFIDELEKEFTQLWEIKWVKEFEDYIVLRKWFDYLKKKIYQFEFWYEKRYYPDFIDINSIKWCLEDPVFLLTYKKDFNIVFNKEDKTEKSYYISVNIDSFYWDELFIQSVLIDVLRDLVFNSVKYSKVWSDIYVSLNQSENNINIKIIDSWIWIKEDMIEEVFKTWVSLKEWTWLWLSKAYYVTKKLDWNLKVKTKEGVWTMFEINIPIKKEEI